MADDTSYLTVSLKKTELKQTSDGYLCPVSEKYSNDMGNVPQHSRSFYPVQLKTALDS